MAKRRKPTKSKRNNNRARRPRVTNALKPFVATQPATQRVARIPRIPRMRPGLTEAGVAFLKCAFASPDFSVDPGKGIPDQFHGRTLSIKDCQTTALSFTANTDTYIVVAPIPGFAYFKAEVPIGTDPTVFTGVPFTTYLTNFGDGTDAQNNFSKFRYASIAAGLYPTSNMMQFSGSIQSWRVDLNLSDNMSSIYSTGTGTSGQGGVVSRRIQGLTGVTTLAPRDNYSGSFINGAYTFGFDKTQDFEWQDFCSATAYATAYTQPATGAPTIVGKSLQAPVSYRLTGLGNTNTIVYKVSTPPGAVNTSLIRVWNCIELQPDTNSNLFQFSGVSPPHDPLAIEAYSRMKMRFPVAMPAADNARFWETVVRVFKEVTGVGMLLPGPIGVISGGLNTAASAIHALF
jgi:hypothetical protein